MKLSLQVAAFVFLQSKYVVSSASRDRHTNQNEHGSYDILANLRGRELGSCFDCSDKNPCAPSLFTSDVYYYPRCGNVTSFVQCGNEGECHIQTCPSGLHWDADALVCSFPQPTHAPSVAPSSSPSASCFDCTDGRNPCDPLAEAGKYYYSNCDAHKYVQCSNAGQCYTHDCPANLRWDDAISTCVSV
mmetsp:Transcript_8069/g.11492  ORF Transcript_8069/g.11492 Transcript_8069/m.11492 type:complete len:188 (+) Transcript_8069:264-827(+)